jgi:hypothetical protein
LKAFQHVLGDLGRVRQAFTDDLQLQQVQQLRPVEERRRRARQQAMTLPFDLLMIPPHLSILVFIQRVGVGSGVSRKVGGEVEVDGAGQVLTRAGLSIIDHDVNLHQTVEGSGESYEKEEGTMDGSGGDGA